MTIEHLEQISGYTARAQRPRPDRSGLRRSSRLMAQAIRANRQHASSRGGAGSSDAPLQSA